jgi:hypothetical protein
MPAHPVNRTVIINMETHMRILQRLLVRFGWALMPLGDARTLHWMARRYADGRQSTSPWSFNRLTRGLLAVGICRPPEDHPDKTVWARDGSGEREFDGLTPDEAALGEEWINRNLKAVQQAYAGR